MVEGNAFERVIKEDRAMRASKQWHGTLLDYLDRVKSDPVGTKLAHARIYDLIISTGIRDIQESDDPRTRRLYKDEPIKVYNFFSDEFFGIEKTIAQLVRYFHSASLKGEESRQVLYLMGPVGSGKSSLVERLQQESKDRGRAARGLQEQLAVQSFDGAALAALTDAHTTCHRELAELEGQCRDLLRQQGVPDSMGLEAFIDLYLAHEARQLQSVRRKLYERLSRSVHASEVNRQSMRFAFEASSAVLQTIGAIPARSTYGPRGMLR